MLGAGARTTASDAPNNDLSARSTIYMCMILYSSRTRRDLSLVVLGTFPRGTYSRIVVLSGSGRLTDKRIWQSNFLCRRRTVRCGLRATDRVRRRPQASIARRANAPCDETSRARKTSLQMACTLTLTDRCRTNHNGGADSEQTAERNTAHAKIRMGARG